jgi:hypothetical protein
MIEYTNKSYEETRKIIEEYFNDHKKDFMINFKIFPLKLDNSNFDLPNNKISLEDKVYGP